MKKFNFILIFTCYLFSQIIFADVSSDLNHFFNSMGMMSNTTAPHAYQGQQAGYYSGGSLYARSSVRNVQLVQVDLPSFRSGCGGIDLFTGGISFVKSEQLVSMMRNIMNNAAGYAFTLTMEEVTPQIANTMKYIQDMANKATQLNINSCENAEALVGGLWPKTRAAQQQVCQDTGSSSGVFSDWTAARQGCTSGDFDKTMQAGSNNPAYKNLVLDNGNLAWKALQANNLVAGDQQFAELLMSLSGSIIIKQAGNGKSVVHLPSLATDPSLFKAILYGNTTKIYQCDETTSCLNPRTQTITVTQLASFKYRVEVLLREIAQKITDDTPLTPQEISFIQSTHIPIFTILNVQSAFQKTPDMLGIESYADVIATDILFQYLQENLMLVSASSRILQYPEEIMREFNAGINVAMSDINAEKIAAQNKAMQAMQLVEQSRVLEKMLAGQLSSQLGNSLRFVRSLH